MLSTFEEGYHGSVSVPSVTMDMLNYRNQTVSSFHTGEIMKIIIDLNQPLGIFTYSLVWSSLI